MDQLRRLEHSQKRNQEMQGDAGKEISRLLEDSRKAIQKINEDGDADKEISKLPEDPRKAIQKINEDVVKKVQQLL